MLPIDVFVYLLMKMHVRIGHDFHVKFTSPNRTLSLSVPVIGLVDQCTCMSYMVIFLKCLQVTGDL